MSEPRTGSRYELQVTRKSTMESKAVGDYFAVHPGDVEEIEDEDDLVGYVHSYEVGSTVDGPGLRFVGFLTGCLLRCQYCHNPDTWHKYNGHPVTVSRAMRQIGKYVHVLKISKGGITLSGGEPMVQRPFVTRIFRRCKELGLHTCMDTSGRLGDRFTDQELMDIDLNLLDIKSGDPAVYETITRQPLQPTLDTRTGFRHWDAPCGSVSCSCRASATISATSRRWPISAPGSGPWSAWRSCASTRWAATSGRSSVSNTR